jgi:hypothetical protein
MVTVPAKPSGGVKTALKDAYGTYDRAEWRVLRWDASAENGGGSGGARGSYREYPQIESLEAGDAFWLVTAQGDSLTLQNGETTAASEAQEIPLKAGWNQVGSPFGYAVPWDTVRAASGLTPSEVDGPRAWADTAYQRAEAAMLRAWTGYFVWVAEADTLTVPPVGPKGAGTTKGRLRAEAGLEALAGEGSSAKSAASTNDSERYTLRLTAHSRDTQAGRVWLGLRPEAKAGRDHLDFAQAPPIGDGVRLSAQEDVGDRSVAHAGSFKPPSGKGRTWTLRLANPGEQTREVRLGFRGDGGLPEGHSRYVLDLSTERRVAPGQTLSLASGERRSLKVIVGTEAFAKTENEGIELETFVNELRGNYPNPFTRETTIGYTLASEQTVTIEVFNVLGQRVRTLVQGKRDPGLHRIRWRGENRYGDPVGSGVYFYRIDADGFAATRKMVLVR